MEVKPLFIGVQKAAQLLGVSASLLYREIDAGRFPAKRIAGRIVISIKVIEQMAEPVDNNGVIRPS